MSIHPVGPANLTHTQIPPPGFPSQIPNFQRNFRKPSIPQTIKFPKEFPEIYTRANPRTVDLILITLTTPCAPKLYVLPQEGSALSSGKGHSPYPRDLSRTLSSTISYQLGTLTNLCTLLASIRTGFAIGVGGCGSLRLRLLPACSLRRRRAEAGSVEAWTAEARAVEGWAGQQGRWPRSGGGIRRRRRRALSSSSPSLSSAGEGGGGEHGGGCD